MDAHPESKNFVGKISTVAPPSLLLGRQDGERIYVNTSGALGKINPVAGTFEGVWDGNRLTALALSKYHDLLFVVHSVDDNKVAVFDVRTEKIVHELIFGYTLVDIAVSDDGRRVYGVGWRGGIYEVDVGTNMIVKTFSGIGDANCAVRKSDTNELYIGANGLVEVLNLHEGTEKFYGFGGDVRDIALSNDERYAFCAIDGRLVEGVGGLARLDTITGSIDSVMFGQRPSFVALTSDSSTVFVSDERLNKIYEVDAQSLQVRHEFDSLREPAGLVVAPDTGLVYSGSALEGWVLVFDPNSVTR